MFVFVPTLTSLHLPLPVQRYAVIYTLFENLSHSSSLLFKEKDKGGGNTHTCIIESTVMVIYLYCKTCNTVYELLLDRCARSSFPVLLSSLMFSCFSQKPVDTKSQRRVQYTVLSVMQPRYMLTVERPVSESASL